MIIYEYDNKLNENELGNTVRSLYNKYRYYTDQSDSKYNFTKNADVSDLRRTPLKDKADKIKYDSLKLDPNNGAVQIVFNVDKLDPDTAKLFDPDNKDKNSLYKYIVKYDDKTATVELPKIESMMTPVQVPDRMRSLQCDENGKLILKDEDDMNKDLNESYSENLGHYKELDTKYVYDTDGFLTDYTLYKDLDSDKFICIYGDRELYNPDNANPDVEFDDENEAYDWFYEYSTDFEDDEDDMNEDYWFGGNGKLDLPDNSNLVDDNDKIDKLELDLNDKETIDEDNELNETTGLVLSNPQLAYKDRDDLEGRLEIKINDKLYKYRLNPDTNLTTQEMIDKINSIKKHSDGKALAYLKKNMHLVNESVNNSKDNKVNRLLKEIKDKFYEIAKSDEFGYESDEEVNDYLNPYFEIVSNDDKTYEINYRAEFYGYDSQSSMDEELNKIIEKYDKDAYFEPVEPGISTAVISLNKNESVDNDSNKLSVKDSIICSKCGNPVGQCSCELDESITYNEDGWPEDVIEICDPFFVNVEKLAYEIRNGVRGIYGFGSTVPELVETFNKLSNDAQLVADSLSQLDDEDLDESINEDYSDEEKKHPLVGKRVRVINTDTNLNGRILTVTRAFDDNRGASVRIDNEDGSNTVTLSPDQYKLISK